MTKVNGMLEKAISDYSKAYSVEFEDDRYTENTMIVSAESEDAAVKKLCERMAFRRKTTAQEIKKTLTVTSIEQAGISDDNGTWYETIYGVKFSDGNEAFFWQHNDALNYADGRKAEITSYDVTTGKMVKGLVRVIG